MIGEGPRKPEPLVVTAKIAGAVSMPWAPIALDGLLAYAVAQREQLPPAVAGLPCEPIEIPVAREPGGRFHLASVSQQVVEARELRWINRRFPLEQGQTLGDKKLRRITLTTGPSKSYRIPLETQHLVEDTLAWWCIGDAEQIRGLLVEITHLGKKRSVGLGEVREWTVAPCVPWKGFPVLVDGYPSRPLPLDWPGLAADADVQMRCLTFPYFDRTRETECAAPRAA